MKIKRNLNIEYMRAIACLGVILIHVMKSAHDVFDNMTPEIYFICTSFVNNLRWCVPVFLMISGYLLLDPEKKIGLIKIKQYIIRIVIVLGIFGTGFAFIELIFEKHSVRFTFIFRAFVNMLMGNTWNHLWYLYALIALYLFLPMLKSITGYLSKQEITYIIIVFLIYSSVFPTLKELGVTIGIAYFSFSIYLFYMLLGYWVRQSKIKISKVLSILGFIGTSLYFVILAYVSDVKGYKIPGIFYSHSSIMVVLQAVLIFSLMGNIKISVDGRLHKIILSIADYSFGMYIMHMFWINILYKVFKLNPAKYGIWIFIPIYIIVIILTYVTAFIMRKIPIIRKYI